MRPPGVEPGQQAWEARVIPLDHGRVHDRGLVFFIRIARTDLFAQKNAQPHRILAVEQNATIPHRIHRRFHR